jgi:preprotein translocase subunit SecG
MLVTVLIVLHVLVALSIIGLVLLQHGKGADMGSGFGGGASGSLFGATGSANFLSRTTAVLAAVFFVLSLALAYTATRRPAEEGGGVIDVIRSRQQPPQTPAPPAAPANQSSVPAPEAPAPAAPAPAAPTSGTPSDKQVPQ